MLPADEVEFRHVVVSGEFRADWPVYLDNRPHQGVAGFYVLMPFRIAGSERYILVARGWVPRDAADRTRLPAIATPAGIVRIEGVARRNPATLAATGHRRMPCVPTPSCKMPTSAGFAAASGLALQPFLLEQLSDTGDGLVRDWPRPSSWRRDASRLRLPVVCAGSDGLDIFCCNRISKWKANKQQQAGRWKLFAVLAVCASPLIASYFTYYVLKPQARTNYGTLLDPRQHPMPALNASTLDGKPAALDAYQGQVGHAARSMTPTASEACREKLFEMRQLRLTQGKEHGPHRTRLAGHRRAAARHHR